MWHEIQKETKKESIVGKRAAEPTAGTLGDKSTIAAMVDPIWCGDANTKLFHIRASARRRKNYIHCLHMDEGIALLTMRKKEW
jgi:hypothetical protein